jgi:hypothetical protein
VSREVVWEAEAIDQAAGFPGEDPGGIREMLDAVARLADQPRPAESFAMAHLTGGDSGSAATGSCTTSALRKFRSGTLAAAGPETDPGR